MRLIDADAKELNQRITINFGAVTRFIIKSILKDAPTIDAVPVVHGRWIDGAENFTCGNHNAECSVCHCNVSWSGCDEDFNYCPNCGARMDGGEDAY